MHLIGFQDSEQTIKLQYLLPERCIRKIAEIYYILKMYAAFLMFVLNIRPQ